MKTKNTVKRKTAKIATVTASPAEICFINENGESVSIVSGSKARNACKANGVNAVRFLVVRTK